MARNASKFLVTPRHLIHFHKSSEADAFLPVNAFRHERGPSAASAINVKCNQPSFHARDMNALAFQRLIAPALRAASSARS